ncbi:MAG: hypothetical protein ABIQ70_00380 [Dokdonella sp.]
MKNMVLTGLVCVLGASACTHLRNPDDQQLATLLHKESAAATNPKATLDQNAIDCLRGWSGDATLRKDLSERFNSEEGKKSCRAALADWIADQARNPKTFTFEELSAPATVHRAVALQTARSLAELADTGNHKIPAALTTAMPVARAPDANVDLGIPGSQLAEAEALCGQVRQVASVPNANQRAVKFGAYCTQNLSRLRRTMESTAQHGQRANLEILVGGANNLSLAARDVLAAVKQ